MFEINSETHDMTLTRGDSASFTINFTGDAPTSNDVVYFAIKKSPNQSSPNYECQATMTASGEYTINITAAQSQTLQHGTYYYDILVAYEDATKRRRPDKPKKFEVIDGVTRSV